MDLFKRFHYDEKLAVEGVWIPYEDAQLLIAKHDNAAFKQAFDKIMRDRVQDAVDGEISEEQATKLWVGVAARTILKGWKNITIRGEEVPYTPEKAEEILSNERYAPFREFVYRQSLRIDNYQKEVIDREKKV